MSCARSRQPQLSKIQRRATTRPEAEYRKAIRLTAKLPTILATYMRRRRGEQPIPPEPSLGHAANFARMAGVDDGHPRAAEILNTCFILQAEHGLNASTFTARVVAGTNADMHAAVTAAFGALKGPLHGGATDGTMKMLDEIGSADHVETFVDKAIATKYKFSGFGHRVYLTEDPRAKHLRRFAMELSQGWKGKPYFEIQERLAKAIAERRPKMSPAAAAKVNVVNVDYYARDDLHVPRDPGRPRHVALRPRTYRWLERAHHGAARRQSADPARVRVQPDPQASATSLSRNASRLFDAAVNARTRAIPRDRTEEDLPHDVVAI